MNPRVHGVSELSLWRRVSRTVDIFEGPLELTSLNATDDPGTKCLPHRKHRFQRQDVSGADFARKPSMTDVGCLRTRDTDAKRHCGRSRCKVSNSD